MNKSILLFFLLNTLSFAQLRSLPAEDHFNYSLGPLHEVGKSWVKVNDSKESESNISVVDGNLSYSGYSMKAAGNQLELKNGTNDNLKLPFDTLDAGQSLFASFLFLLKHTTGLLSGAGAPFAAFGNDSNEIPINISQILIKAVGDGYSLGLSQTNSEQAWSDTLTVGKTYLIVLSIQKQSIGSDIANLWINPSEELEPAPSVTVSGTNSIIDGFYFYQNLEGTPNGLIDGLRIDYSWPVKPVPVELLSFNAFVKNKKVRLTWQTALEFNNYGFDLERKLPNEKLWEKLSFIPGYGTSSGPKKYSFVDRDILQFGKYSYRLKQVSQNGKNEYLKTISTEVTQEPEFELEQNYPNPFNPVTNIKFFLPKEEHVTLTIYNLLGQEITTVLSEFYPAGEHNFELTSEGLNSGVYIYKLTAGDLVETRKMTVVK